MKEEKELFCTIKKLTFKSAGKTHSNLEVNKENASLILTNASH